ncbi:MAG: hypothetical protein QGF59_29265 [Pirellulaceae bacterium]|nr:hypothetical protein [Pirellulaceae bacterium]
MLRPPRTLFQVGDRTCEASIARNTTFIINDSTDLIEAKRLVDKLGLEKARAAVELLAKLS